MFKNFIVTASRSVDRFIVREPFTDFFPPAEFNSYDAFVSDRGSCLKSEPRTRVMLVEHRRARVLNGDAERFVVKEYYYPLLPRIRTWLQHSKAEHEFKSLLQVQRLGVTAAEPAAFGARRTLLGFVRSCFIITRYIENSHTLEQWIKEGRKLGKTEAELNCSVAAAVGQAFRRLHQGNLFLFTAKPKNILLRRTATTPEIVIIDIPYALRIAKQSLARWAQAFDLAVFLANLARISSEDQKTSFYDAYLPDPLGAPREDLERRVIGATRWRRNQTPVSSLVHSIRRAVMKWQRRKGKRMANFRGSTKSHLGVFAIFQIPERGGFETAICLLEMLL
jgi:tRNA A-37 threonylcarbamoyl transferase component Bud32